MSSVFLRGFKIVYNFKTQIHLNNNHRKSAFQREKPNSKEDDVVGDWAGLIAAIEDRHSFASSGRLSKARDIFGHAYQGSEL